MTECCGRTSRHTFQASRSRFCGCAFLVRPPFVALPQCRAAITGGPFMSDEKKGQTPERVLQSTTKTRVVNLSLGKLSNPAKDPGNHAHRSDDKYQPANLEDLSESIKCHGLLDPPLVAKRSDGRYEIVSGHRRVASLFVLAGRS